MKVDAIFDSLVTPDDNTDALTLSILQLLAKTLTTYSSRLLADHLTSGKFGQPSDSLLSEASSVPATNPTSESNFGSLDNQLRAKPNAATIALEGVILFANNKTREWLEQKPDKEKEQILTAARTLSLFDLQRKI